MLLKKKKKKNLITLFYQVNIQIYKSQIGWQTNVIFQKQQGLGKDLNLQNQPKV